MTRTTRDHETITAAKAVGFAVSVYATTCATSTHPAGVACGMAVTHEYRGDVARVIVMSDGRHWYQAPSYGSPLDPLPWRVDRRPTPRANELISWVAAHADDLLTMAREYQRATDATAATRRAKLERLAQGVAA